MLNVVLANKRKIWFHGTKKFDWKFKCHKWNQLVQAFIYLLFIVNPLIRWLIRSTDLTAGNQLLVGKCIVCSGSEVFNQLQFVENISLALSIISEFSQEARSGSSIIMGMKRKFVSRKNDSEEELDPMLLHEPEIRRPTRQDISRCFSNTGSPKFQQFPELRFVATVTTDGRVKFVPAV